MNTIERIEARDEVRETITGEFHKMVSRDEWAAIKAVVEAAIILRDTRNAVEQDMAECQLACALSKLEGE